VVGHQHAVLVVLFAKVFALELKGYFVVVEIGVLVHFLEHVPVLVLFLICFIIILNLVPVLVYEYLLVVRRFLTFTTLLTHFS
jgi:hypothetical protein